MTKNKCCCTTMEAKPCLCQVKISLFCPSIVTHFAHFVAHFVRGGRRDDHRPNRKRLRAILLLSGQNDLAIQFAFISKDTSSQQRHLLKNTRMAVNSYQLSPELKKFWHCEKFGHVGRILSRMKCCHGRK